MAFASSSKPPHCPGRVVTVETTAARRPPLLGFVGTPLHRRARGSGPVGVAAAGTSRDATPETVPLTWFRTTSADYRPLESQAYCSLLPILGFVAFPCVPPATGQADNRAQRLSRDAGSYPSKNPLAGSRTASPRPLPSCGSTASIQPLARPDGAPDQSDGLWPTDCSADLHTWHRSGPLMQAAPRSPHPCGQRHRNPARPGGVATSGPCSTDEFVLARSGMDTGTKPARFFLGFVPLQGPPAAPLRVQPTPPPPKRQGHRAPIRRPVDACRARCDEDPQAPSLGGRRHRQAGILDRTRPLRAVPPGACSHRTGDGIPPRVTLPPLARRPGAPGVCPEPEVASGSAAIRTV
jgi:hypothetical protein